MIITNQEDVIKCLAASQLESKRFVATLAKHAATNV